MNYVCSICGKSGVKLWRPCEKVYPLICAQCAEDHQIVRQVHEIVHNDGKDDSIFSAGTITIRTNSLPHWNIDENGRITTYHYTGNDKPLMFMTDQLFVDLCRFSMGTTLLIPAYPTKDDTFWGYPSAPYESIKWWQELPTKINCN